MLGNIGERGRDEELKQGMRVDEGKGYGNLSLLWRSLVAVSWFKWGLS